MIRPSSYFHQPYDDMKKIKEEIWEMVQKEMGSNNMRQQPVLQPVVVEKPMFKMIEEPQPPEPPLKHKVCIYLLIIQD